MKRKIRKKRLILRQKIKAQNPKTVFDVCDYYLEKSAYHSYAILANNEQYIFFWVIFHYGWELFPPIGIVFLYDKVMRQVKCCMPNFLSNNTAPIFEITQSISDDVHIEDMMNWIPPNKKIYDTAYYTIFIKNGELRRLIGLTSSDEIIDISPFCWLIKVFKQVKEQLRNNIEE